MQRKRNQVDILKTKKVMSKKVTSSTKMWSKSGSSITGCLFAHNLLSFQDIDLIPTALDR